MSALLTPGGGPSWPPPSAHFGAAVSLGPAEAVAHDTTPGGCTWAAPDAATAFTGTRRAPRLRWVVYLLSSTWCWAVVALLAWTLIPAAFGMTPTVIATGSMRSVIDPGDVVAVQHGVSDEQLLVPGRILTFDDPSVPGRVTTHRLVEIDDQGMLWTKGDANPDRDSTPVGRQQVHGMARIVVPGIGLPQIWWRNGQRHLVTISVVGTLLASFVLMGAGLPGVPAPPASTSGRAGRRRPTPRLIRRGLACLLLGAVAVASAGFSTAAAGFAGTSVSGGSAFTYAQAMMASYTQEVLADAPTFWWRLGESDDRPTFREGFEGDFTWTLSGSDLAPSTTQAHTGTRSGRTTEKKTDRGAYHPLGFTTGSTWTATGWTYRPARGGKDGESRLALLDDTNAGHEIIMDFKTGTIAVERKDSFASGVRIAQAPVNLTYDQWIQVTLQRTGSQLQATAHDVSGNLLGSVSANDPSHPSSTRVAIMGGKEYFVDDIQVTDGELIARDTQQVHDGFYRGSPGLGQPTLIAGEADTSTGFSGDDHVLLLGNSQLNQASRTQRSVELWFQADSTIGRQVLYEEGDATNGLNIYLDGGALRGRAWGNDAGWSNELDTVHPITAGTATHVTLTLDTAAQPALVLYVDGTAVSTASKSDTGPWPAHADEGGIGAALDDTRYHDGPFDGQDQNPTSFFKGRLDDVAVYNAVLSPQRVAAHANAGR